MKSMRKVKWNWFDLSEILFSEATSWNSLLFQRFCWRCIVKIFNWKSNSHFPLMSDLKNHKKCMTATSCATNGTNLRKAFDDKHFKIKAHSRLMCELTSTLCRWHFCASLYFPLKIWWEEKSFVKLSILLVRFSIRKGESFKLLLMLWRV